MRAFRDRGILIPLILIGLVCIGCVGPTERPLPLPPPSEQPRYQLVLKETYIAGVMGAEYLLPYGTYSAEGRDQRGVYYSAPVPLKKRGIFGGAFGRKESLVNGGIYLPGSSFGRFVGPWIYLREREGVMRTTTLPTSFSRGEGNFWYLERETPPQQVALGQCEEGNPHGSYVVELVDGPVIIEGAFLHGNRHGVFRFYSGGGLKVAEIPYEMNKKNGVVHLWYSASPFPEAAGQRKLEAEYRDDVVTGKKRTWWPSGAKRSEELFENGTALEVTAWFEDGRRMPKHDAQALSESGIEADSEYYEILEAEVDSHPPPCTEPAA